MTRLFVIAAAIATATACTNSGLGGGLTEDSGGATVPTNTGSSARSCPWEGTWDMTQVWCIGIDATEDWEASYNITRIKVSDAGDGACAVEYTLRNDQCVEKEDWDVTPNDATDELVVDFKGISSCDPAGCQFFGGDDSCSEGDRTDGESTLEFEEIQDGLIRITGLLVPNFPSTCPDNDVTTQWVRQ